MLPSKDQLFKTINCPFYEADPESCNRPYCHFKHSKSENSSDSTKSAVNQQNTQSSKPPIPVYIPTPKHILEGRKSNGSTSTECSVSKRPKLEYVPKAITNQNEPIPTYIPSSVPNPMANDEYEPTPIFGNDNAGTSNVFGGNVNSNGDDIIGLLTELSSEQITNNENRIENIPNNDTPKIHDSTDLATKKSKENSHKSSSSSSSSRHRHHSSSSSHKSSHSERKSSSSSSTHKSSHRSSRKSKHSDRDKDRDKDKSKHSSKSSKDSRHKSEHRSKSSSSSSSSRHHSDKKTHSSNNGNSNKSKDCINSTVVYETDSEEDDVEAQCRMIFDEFDTSTVEIKPDDMPNNASTEEEETPTKIEDVTKKKRVAHDNADKQNRLLAPFKKQADHVKNALQSVFMRQEIVRKQNESKFAEERKEKEKRDLLASLESDKPEPKVLAPKQNLTPLIPPAALVAPKFPPKIFSPVSNMLAIERAKEKVMQLKAQKIAQHQQFLPKTIAQTTPKGTGRVAHTITNAIAAQNTKPAPPVLEPTSTKISYNIRMQYYNLMVKHCLTIYDDCNDAWERAQTEELAVFQKCKTPVIYKSSALLTINKLRKESLDAGNINTEKNKVISHDVILAGKHGQNTSWNLNRKPSSDGSNIVDSVASSKAYEMIADLCMTDEQLKENGYPRSGNRPGSAVIHKKQGAAPANPDDRYCRRCGKVFKLDEYDEECIDRCNYHPKSPGFRRGFADNSHRCCQQPAGSPGCMYANYHVTDYLDLNNLTGFIKTIGCDDDYVPTRKDIFALDCEMCYTTVGLELTRVTVVDINRKIVYDALVKPDNRIIDYNTTYSGISEKTLENVNRTLRDVQAVLLSMFNSKSILVGHSLESDFKALKLIHDKVVDTSILFPHKMGPPKKRALKTLCIENLKRIIQEDDGGHNSAEDAEVCIDLIKFYLRNRII